MTSMESTASHCYLRLRHYASMLEYLLKLSPLDFMQQVTMYNNDCAFRRFTPLSAAINQAALGKADQVCELIEWLCESGVMTDAVLESGCCSTDADEVWFMDFPMPELARSTLKQWTTQPKRERERRTRERFVG